MKNDEIPEWRGWLDVGKAKRAISGGTGVVIYSYENGWKKRVTVARPSVRNNNPGNLHYEKLQNAIDDGALTIDKDGYAIFPDWMTGKRAADKWWEDARNRNETIEEAMTRYLKKDEPGARQRKEDLEKEALHRGYRDRHGRPVDRKTLLSDLTDEEFVALRDYSTIQLEGFREWASKEKVEWIPPSQGAQAPAGTQQSPAPTTKSPLPPLPPTPAIPQSSLDRPLLPNRLASREMGMLSAPELVAGPNRFLSPGPSRPFQTSLPAPPAPYPGEASPPLGSLSLPRMGGRPNPLASPSSFDSLALGSRSLPGASGQAQPPLPSGQAKKPPFSSLKDKLDFLRRVYRVAKPLSERTGLSLPFILAHAAHEGGWGKNIEGNNLFNLKADETWEGPTFTKGNAKYRSYPSYEESMKDYLSSLSANPRYGKMLEPATRSSLGRLADAIRYTGFSDDPLYGLRILAAAKSPLMREALWQYERWPPKESPER